MKKLLLISMLFLAFSCSEDDSSEVQSEPTILGTWVGVESYLNGESEGVPTNNEVTFTSDNRAEFTYGDISEYGDYVLDGEVITITWDDAGAGLETYVLEINELTENTLRWETNIEGEGNLVEVFER